MQKKQNLLLILLLCISKISFSQSVDSIKITTTNPPISIELFVGEREFQFQSIFVKNIDSKQKFKVFNVSFYAVDYKNTPKKIQFVNLTTVHYTFMKGFSIAAGGYYNHLQGFRPTAGVEYIFANKNWLLIAYPRVDLNNDNNVELFTLAEFKPKISEKVNLYTRIQGLYNHNSRNDFHERSYCNLRLGLSFKTTQLGVGLNLDQYGPDKTFYTNIGGFGRILLFN